MTKAIWRLGALAAFAFDGFDVLVVIHNFIEKPMAFLLKPTSIVCVCLLFRAQSWAGEGDISSVYIENAAIIQAAYGGHQAGNIEVKVLNGFSMPPGVSCDGQYITTLKSVDSDRKLFALLTIAQITKKPISLHITDNPTYTAFGGRCSILGASLQ